MQIEIDDEIIDKVNKIMEEKGGFRFYKCDVPTARNAINGIMKWMIAMEEAYDLVKVGEELRKTQEGK